MLLSIFDDTTENQVVYLYYISSSKYIISTVSMNQCHTATSTYLQVTIQSVFGTGDAGTIGNHRFENFPAPSQDRSKGPLGNHVMHLQYFSIATSLYCTVAMCFIVSPIEIFCCFYINCTKLGHVV